MHEEKTKLDDVAPEETFKAHNGSEIKNLRQLIGVLNEISSESFAHHVNKEKNDFAKWVRHSVKDGELADVMEKTTDFEETKHAVSMRIDALEKAEEMAKPEDTSSMKPEDIGLDSVPDELSKPEMHDMPSGPQDPAVETHPSELRQANPHMNTPLTLEEQQAAAAQGSQHPFEQVKRNLHLVIRDFMVGLLIGLVLGYIIGAFM